MQFRDIPNFEQTKGKLISSANNDRVGHSLLFLGEEGSPALAIALAFAQFLSCENPEKDDSCGQCKSCAKFSKFAHPDLHFYFPTATSKSVPKKALSHLYMEEWRKFLEENLFTSLNTWLSYMETDKKDAIIPTDDSLNIIKDLSLKSYESPYRYAIIWLPEKMNVHSSNRLLKIIEEPPENTFFFLVSENVEDVLATIVSRTQIIRVGRMENGSLEEYLNATYTDKSQSDILFALKMADGNALRAIESLEKQQDHTAEAENFIQWARLCYAMNSKLPELVDWVDGMAGQSRAAQRSFLMYGLDFIRAGMITVNQADELVHVFPEEEKSIKNFSALLNAGNIPKINEKLNTTLTNLARNANVKVLFMDLSIAFGRLINPKNINL